MRKSYPFSFMNKMTAVAQHFFIYSIHNMDALIKFFYHNVARPN